MTKMAITVWKDGGYKLWSALDATYAQDDPEWLATIPIEMASFTQPTASFEARVEAAEQALRAEESLPSDDALLTAAIRWRIALILHAADAIGTPSPTLQRIKERIDMRMNDYLCEMKPEYDDSITGFNEAWDIVRATLAEALVAAPHPSPALPAEVAALVERAATRIDIAMAAVENKYDGKFIHPAAWQEIESALAALIAAIPLAATAPEAKGNGR